MKWECVIGLEIHIQLKTKSKLFSGASTIYGAKPNTNASYIDAGYPGMLPTLNEEAIKMAIKFGLSINASVNKLSTFDRKNYFYPDLPKGYQISQFNNPIIDNGYINIETRSGLKKINIERAHIEEDAGKSIHSNSNNYSYVDLNRAGVPLIEVVSKPEISTPEEAVEYMKKIHSITKYIDISTGNMQEGALRCDANVSLKPIGSNKLGTRTEIKNLNSFRYVEKAIQCEIKRQQDILENGGTIITETMMYDSGKNITRAMRVKGEEQDYMYFPEPDLPSLRITDDYIASIRASMPELPDEKRDRFINQYNLSSYDACILVADQDIANYFESITNKTKAISKIVANWIMGEISAALNKESLNIKDCPIEEKEIVHLLDFIYDKTISNTSAKKAFNLMWQSGDSADTIIKNQNLRQNNDISVINKIIEKVLSDNSEQVIQYKGGKEKLFGFFVGQAMKEAKGTLSPDIIKKTLIEKLK